MWQRFTERARRVILLGQEEAGKWNSSHVGTEHLLLGLLRENEGVAAQVLTKMVITYELVLHKIREEIKQTEEADSSEPRLTPRAKRVLELAAEESRRMRHNYIGTEHLLVALLLEKDGAAATILRKFGLDLETVRRLVDEYNWPKIEANERPGGTFVVMEEQDAQKTARAQRAKRMASLDWMLPMLTRLLPRELREMGQQLRDLHKQKEIAVLQDDYETAAIFRDEANALEKCMEEFADEWEAKVNAESWDSSRETLDFVVQSLISTVEAALDALSSGDEAKIAEIKERLRGLLEATRSKEATDEQQDDE